MFAGGGEVETLIDLEDGPSLPALLRNHFRIVSALSGLTLRGITGDKSATSILRSRRAVPRASGLMRMSSTMPQEPHVNAATTFTSIVRAAVEAAVEGDLSRSIRTHTAPAPDHAIVSSEAGLRSATADGPVLAPLSSEGDAACGGAVVTAWTAEPGPYSAAVRHAADHFLHHARRAKPWALVVAPRTDGRITIVGNVPLPDIDTVDLRGGDAHGGISHEVSCGATE